MKNTFEQVIGWTMVRNKKELLEFERHYQVSYRQIGTSFPCLVQYQLASDENLETVILTEDDLRSMLALLERGKHK